MSGGRKEKSEREMLKKAHSKLNFACINYAAETTCPKGNGDGEARALCREPEQGRERWEWQGGGRLYEHDKSFVDVCAWQRNAKINLQAHAGYTRLADAL